MNGNNYIKKVLDGMKEFICIYDKNFNLLYFNKNYENILKYTYQIPEINIGDNILDLIKHLPAEVEKFKTLFDIVFDKGEHIEIESFGKGEYKKIYELSGYPILENNEIVGVSAIIRDVTEREKLRKQAQEAIESKSLFLSSVSHELRTPLNSIIGFIQLMTLDKNKENIPQYTQSINRSSALLLELVNNILDVNKINSNILSISLDTFNVYNTLLNIYNDMKILSNKNNLTFTIDIDKFKDINLKTDIHRYKQIIINLISNAIKYNKINGNIHLSGSIEENTFYTIVKDTGIGISKENLKIIGTPFERLSFESSSIEGTGLGMSIVKKLCKLMNGKLDVNSELGKGSEFKVGFNIESKSILKAKKENLNFSINTKFNGKILYVEDNYFNLQLMKRIINIYFPNAVYKELNDGKNVIKTIKTDKPDIVLIDLDLPSVSGIDILKENENKNKIIIVTADITDKTYKQCVESGVKSYITKPFIIPKLIKTINENIENHLIQP